MPDTATVAAAPPAPEPVRMRVPSLTPKAPTRARLGETIAVTVTVYCLKGTTRRGNDVREGIVAVDPRVFPLGSEIDLWIRGEYIGRFLADDTGRLINGARLDLWMPDCRQALVFGRKRGVAQLVR